MKYGYEIRPSASDASHQKPPAKRPHNMIGDAIILVLEESGLPEKLWSHALYHYAEVDSYLLHCSRDKTPHEIVTGKQP
eukprot:8151130-Ditylum_brightwellii.AAC.1